MFKLLSRLLIAWGVWRYIQGRVGQYAFGAVSLSAIWYVTGQVEAYFLLTKRADLLPSLLIVKNLLYISALILFLAWPFFFGRSVEQTSGPEHGKHNKSASKDPNSELIGDEFDKIRQKGRARTPSEIQLEQIRDKKNNVRK